MFTVFTGARKVEAILEFEAALALALADAGIAPADEADEVAAACLAGVDIPDEILVSTWEQGTPLIALKEAIVARVGGEAGQWFHYGATTQDAIDTGHMIQASQALHIIDDRLAGMARRLRDLTVEYRNQPQMGVTFLQDARPTTFGFRTATWLDAVVGHLRELRSQRDTLAVQLGGPVGTMAEYGEAAPKVLTALAERLELTTPAISWHANRTPILSLAQAVERAGLSMAKVGSDVALLARSGEVSVRDGGSSSMPGKQNPIDSIRAVAAATACSGSVGMLTGAPPHELDRGLGGWHVEWLALPLVFQTGDAAIEAIGRCLDSLEVDTGVMAAGVDTGATTDSTQMDTVLKECDRILGH